LLAKALARSPEQQQQQQHDDRARDKHVKTEQLGKLLDNRFGTKKPLHEDLLSEAITMYNALYDTDPPGEAREGGGSPTRKATLHTAPDELDDATVASVHSPLTADGEAFDEPSLCADGVSALFKLALIQALVNLSLDPGFPRDARRARRGL
jgi:hypothetical protein